MLNAEQVRSVLPQKGAAVMVDTLLRSSELTAESQYTVAENNIYLSYVDGAHSLVIENMAQTFLLGAYCAANGTAGNSLYLLAAVNYLKMSGELRPNDRIETTTRLIKSAMGISKVEGKTYLGSTLIAESEFVLKEIKNV